MIVFWHVEYDRMCLRFRADHTAWIILQRTTYIFVNAAVLLIDSVLHNVGASLGEVHDNIIVRSHVHSWYLTVTLESLVDKLVISLALRRLQLQHLVERSFAILTKETLIVWLNIIATTAPIDWVFLVVVVTSYFVIRRRLHWIVLSAAKVIDFLISVADRLPWLVSLHITTSLFLRHYVQLSWLLHDVPWRGLGSIR